MYQQPLVFDVAGCTPIVVVSTFPLSLPLFGIVIMVVVLQPLQSQIASR